MLRDMAYTRKTTRTFLQVLAVALTLMFAVQPAVAAAAPDEPVASAAWDDRTGESLQAWECDWGNVCFWPEYNGAGARCMWSVDDPYWTSGSVTCSWAANWNVRSVMNMKPANSGGGIGVIYYKKSDYNDRVGCTKPEHGGNLAGTYQLRSHRWMPSGSCG
jgi:hypothetical protein